MAEPREIDLTDLDFSTIIRPGDHVLWTQGAGEPIPLIERLLQSRHTIGRFSVLLGASYADLVRPEHADCIDFRSLGAVGTTRRMVESGHADVVPCHLSEAARLLARGNWPTDVVLVQFAEHPQTGELSFSTVNGYVGAALPLARTVVAEINKQAPWTTARTSVDRSDVDIIVRTDRPLVESELGEPSAIDERIADHVADLIADGSVIQLGIGGVPRAVGRRLTRFRDLSIHTGVIGDAIVELIESGAVTNARKPIDRGITVTGGLVGTKRLFDFAHLNPQLAVEPVGYTHAAAVLAGLPGLVAVNSALEVDLTGQVGSEVAGSRYVGAIGGQADFARGAMAAEGGRSIIALPSITSRDSSRIVARLRSQTVTLSRADADVVVTEWGRAELRGRSLRERMRALIDIAHPDSRDDLTRQARELVPVRAPAEIGGTEGL